MAIDLSMQVFTPGSASIDCSYG